MRILVIGDLHGAFKALIQVLEKSQYNPLKDQLIFLGDYVDGWNESAQLVQHLIDIEKEAVNKPIFLRGNHDIWVDDWLNKGIEGLTWLIQGGKATKQSYLDTGFLIHEDHRKFFRNLHNYYVDDKNRAFVHGGFVSEEGLGNDYEYIYYWDRSLWENSQSQYLKKSKNKYRSYFYEEVYIGHTTTGIHNIKPHYPEYKDPNQAKNGPITVPMNRLNIWNLDTGGGYEGKVTIMDIDTKEYWQSEFVKKLYENN